MQRFHLHRDTTLIAEGICWTDGRVALHWLEPPCSTTHYDTLADLRLIHNDSNNTSVIIIDPHNHHHRR